MAHLATSAFLEQLKAAFAGPKEPSVHPVLDDLWYLVVVVAFSASNEPQAIPVVWKYVLHELDTAREKDLTPEQMHQERLALARKFREALFQSGLMSGMPRAINGLIALNNVMPEELREKQILRDTKKQLTECEQSGRELFSTMFGDQTEAAHSRFDSAYPDLGWWCTTIGLGVLWGGTSVLSHVETSFVIVAALIAVDASVQTGWHLVNAMNVGATREETRAVRQTAMDVARKAGIVWKSAVPDVA
ncbi:hypothetical protein OBBRIDRAFT_753867 [Obba rivulosa]|uniref:Carboxymuconolactone decarboxylase-like domain-containing protein n=1 Tax=Obba rivulosa TaxID=1052685 RepID=A0A8E2DLI5_9APHY|nr:hypothetical protein OBBRIDRAFT_753867 [Obba rivulosa]